MTTSPFIHDAETLLRDIRGKSLTRDDWKLLTGELATLILSESMQEITREERGTQAQLARMMNDPVGKAFTMAMTDGCFRSANESRIADQLVYLLNKMGTPQYLSFSKYMGMELVRVLGNKFSSILIPLLQKLIRQETSRVILPGESDKLKAHMIRRQLEGVRVNLNHLGEAILGEEEAQSRLAIYLNSLAQEEVEYVSVKISTIFSQINLLAWDYSLENLRNRLRALYRMAMNHRFRRHDGTTAPKFVNLDMEEHRDLLLTVALFQEVLDEPQFQQLSAGIVLQSYLPDSFRIQQELTRWAVHRVAQGGAPIKIRIVKGANLAMEILEGSLKGWPAATYETKREVDANYKRMVIFGCQRDHAKAVHLGIASHNLFDIAFAMILRAQFRVEELVEFEMLEGMADQQRRAVQKLSQTILLYCPVARQEEFQNAVAYLIRRLDENTAPENFLRHTFDLTPSSEEWENQAKAFTSALELVTKVAASPRRTQNRNHTPVAPDTDSPFQNEPDTDFSLPENRSWALEILKEWKDKSHSLIPTVIAGEAPPTKTQIGGGRDPSQPEKPLFYYALADWPAINEALDGAVEAQSWWGKSTPRRRIDLLAGSAHALRCNRADLIGAMVANTAKSIPEADAEISEAIDFAEYYLRSLKELYALDELQWSPKGVILVAPPWNFPCSIPAGGIFAAIAGGNSVLFKPAPEAVLVGWHLASLLWEAGIPKEILQFIPCPEDPVGCQLLNDKRLSAVILTGGTATAKFFLQLRPDLDLMAETGGKNSLIITNMADRDQAIKDLVQSAFGHSGQKCSAASLAICEAEVYDDPSFHRQLKDAVASLSVGSAWDPKNKITPMVNTPSGPLKQAMASLEKGESWLLTPRIVEGNPHLLSPGIKIGVRRGSYTHTKELFGPILSVMRARNVKEAIAIANDTPYGLTAGIHSLDEREQKLWKEEIQAGNLYINRTITGAIVQRQPFGGCKESNFGPGAKAGGPNYLVQMMHATQKGLPKEGKPPSKEIAAFGIFLRDHLGWSRTIEALWDASVSSYAYWWETMKEPVDKSQLLGQDNFFIHLPRKIITLRVQEQDVVFDLCRIIAASMTCGTHLEVSFPPEISHSPEQKGWVEHFASLPKVSCIIESEPAFLERLNNGSISRMRLASKAPQKMLQAAAERGTYIAYEPVLASGRVELLHYVREVSISHDYHRYGNLGLREGEPRIGPPASDA